MTVERGEGTTADRKGREEDREAQGHGAVPPESVADGTLMNLAQPCTRGSVLASVGGVLVSLANWRAVFGVNVVIGIPAIVRSICSMPSMARRNRRLDYAGMVAATVLIGGLVFGLIEAPAKGWGTPGALTAFTLAIVGLLAFVQAERTATAALLPTAVYTDRSFVTSALQGTLFNFAFYGLLFAMSLMLQQGRGLSAIESGLLFLPLTGLISLDSICAATFTRRAGRRAVLGIGQFVLAAALAAVALTSTLSSLWPLVIALLPAGFSAGVLVPTMTSQSIAAVPPTLHGAASAVFNTSRQIGAAIGIATFGPLLGSAGQLRDGFTTCVLVAAVATGLALILTLTNRVTVRNRVSADTVDAKA